MKKLVLILSMLMTGLSGCFVEPIRGGDGGYRNDREHRDGSEQRRDRDGDRRDHDGYR